jgi:hypothetical protein
MEMIRRTIAVPLVALIFAVLPLEALSYQAWRTCVTISGSTCPLDVPASGYYLVDSTIEVSGNYVTISGSGTYPGSIMLRRSSPSNYQIMHITGFYVYITNLTFDGNRGIFPNSSYQPLHGPAGAYGCTPGNFPLLDVVTAAPTVFNSVWFLNAPGDGLSLLGPSMLLNSFVMYARSTGVRVYDSSTVASTTFLYSGTAAINIQGFGALVQFNTLAMNRYEMSDGTGGGQLFLGESSADTLVMENSINGGMWRTTPGSTIGPYGCYAPSGGIERPAGVEAYSRRPDDSVGNWYLPPQMAGLLGHRFYNNDISFNTAAGLSLGGTDGVVVNGDDPNCFGCTIKYIQRNGDPDPNFFPGRGIGIGPHEVCRPDTNFKCQITACPDYTDSDYCEWRTNTSVTMNSVRVKYNVGDQINVDSGTTGAGYTGTACLNLLIPGYGYALYVPSAAPFPFFPPPLGNPIPNYTSCP